MKGKVEVDAKEILAVIVMFMLMMALIGHLWVELKTSRNNERTVGRMNYQLIKGASTNSVTVTNK